MRVWQAEIKQFDGDESSRLFGTKERAKKWLKEELNVEKLPWDYKESPNATINSFSFTDNDGLDLIVSLCRREVF